MFKIGSFEEEIAKSMADNLAVKRIEQSKEILKTAEAIKQTKISRALEHLTSASKLFDSAGYKVSSNIVSQLLTKLADSQEKKEEEPEMVEFKSLLFGDEDEKEDDLGEQIIEIESIASDSKKKV